MRRIFITLAVALSAPAAAELYVCKKEGGGVSYISAATPPAGDCTLQQSYERKPATKPTQQTQSATPPPRTPTAAPIPKRDRPVVSTAAQKARDKKREEILRGELQREQEIYDSLSDALLSEKEKTSPDDWYIGRLTELANIHVQNIKAIQQELARL